MAEYQRPTQRFAFSGISVLPSDLLPPGKLPYLRNMRSYVDGSLSPRAGLAVQSDAGFGATVHSLMRLNDPTTFNGGVPAVRVIGAGGSLFRGAVPGTAYGAAIDTGYSGNPLVSFAAQPPQSPRPYLYVADSAKYRKLTTNGNPLQVGLAQPSAPSTEPLAVVDVQHISAHDIQTSAAWTNAGTVASVPSTVNKRIDTIISQILYDIGATGYASIVPANTANITVGTLLTVGNPSGSFENALVTDVTIAVASTTVAAIVYDQGTTGLCTIQPAGSLGTGQLDAPPIDAYRRRAYLTQGTAFAVPRGEAGGLPPTPDPSLPVRRIRQVDFPVDGLIVLNGAETVRILSVAVGPAGVQSFRCSTAGTISAGQTITGLSAFRIFLSSTWTAGDGLLRQMLTNTLTYVTPAEGEKPRITGGIQAPYVINLSQFSNGQAVLPEDELHLAINVDRLTEIVSVRIYIDVDASVNDFLQNYYFHEWRASDIISAIQGTNAENVTPLVDARRTVVANQQLETPQVPLKSQTYAQRIQARKEAAAAQHQANSQRQRQPIASTAISTQLGLGNSQWVDLRVKIGTLVHVGTDPTRTLANAAAFEILLVAEGPTEDVVPSPLNIAYSDLQIYGGGGPDVGEVGDPYVWTYRYRSTETGAKSNPAPATRGGSIPRRQNVDLTPTPSTDPQVDKIDWFRLGGALTDYTYVGTGPNSSSPFRDDRIDTAIDGGETLAYNNFQPWPLQDLPRTGTCDVAGSALRRVSGDVFNTAWAPGSIILVNGRATTLYASPLDANTLFVVDNVGSGSAVDFALPGPTLLDQPLGRAWGPYQGFFFACGDAINPGTLYFSNGNDVESANDSNTVIVTSPSEQLQNGGIYNVFPFVFSTSNLYALQLTPGADSPFRAIQTPCGRGLWTPWAFDLGPEGIFFLAGDGIFVTAGGSPAKSLTDADLRAIFPKDGIPGVSVNNIPAVDMSQTTRLRLAYISGWLYFDYVDLNGAGRTLILDIAGNRWFLDDTSLTDVSVRLQEPGAGVYDQILGATNGFLYQYDAAAIRDDSADLSWDVWTPWIDGGAARTVKQFGDIGVDLNAADSIGGILSSPVTNDGKTFPSGAILGAGDTGRQSYIVNLANGVGVLTRNLGMRFSGSLVAGDTARPTLFWWEPAFLVKVDDVSRRTTDWDDLGYQGAKFVQGIIIRANTYGQNKVLEIQKDGGVLGIPQLTINHNGEQQIAYPLAAAGWLPFVTELIRIVGADEQDWQLLGYRFVWEPAPELATQWETQFTSEDWPGYGTVRDMVFAYSADAPVVLTFTYDDRQQIYTLPSTSGLYRRHYFVFCPNKELANKFQWKSEEPFRVYKKDVATRICGWGDAGGYRVANPFGGPSRADGATI